jgi:DNA-binding beta-propeller fold protein YncE
VDEEGNLLVLCRDANRLYKYLHSASYDSLISLGGNALGREGLNQPTELWAHDRQTTYVLDAGNRRLVLVNPNLRVVRYVDFLATPVSIPGEPPLYITPAAVASNALGELFVLNQDDNRIFKFDRFGQFELVFGGPDWGEGRLLAPTQLLTNDRQWVYVSEPEQHRVLVFDNFGTFREPIPVPDSLGPWQRMVCMSDAIGVVGTHQLALWRPTAQQWLRFSLADAAPVTDAVLTVRGVYVLSGQGNVLLFKP